MNLFKRIIAIPKRILSTFSKASNQDPKIPSSQGQGSGVEINKPQTKGRSLTQAPSVANVKIAAKPLD